MDARPDVLDLRALRRLLDESRRAREERVRNAKLDEELEDEPVDLLGEQEEEAPRPYRIPLYQGAQAEPEEPEEIDLGFDEDKDEPAVELIEDEEGEGEPPAKRPKVKKRTGALVPAPGESLEDFRKLLRRDYCGLRGRTVVGIVFDGKRGPQTVRVHRTLRINGERITAAKSLQATFETLEEVFREAAETCDLKIIEGAMATGTVTWRDLEERKLNLLHGWESEKVRDTWEKFKAAERTPKPPTPPKPAAPRGGGKKRSSFESEGEEESESEPEWEEEQEDEEEGGGGGGDRRRKRQARAGPKARSAKLRQYFEANKLGIPPLLIGVRVYPEKAHNGLTARRGSNGMFKYKGEPVKVKTTQFDLNQYAKAALFCDQEVIKQMKALGASAQEIRDVILNYDLGIYADAGVSRELQGTTAPTLKNIETKLALAPGRIDLAMEFFRTKGAQIPAGHVPPSVAVADGAGGGGGGAGAHPPGPPRPPVEDPICLAPAAPPAPPRRALPQAPAAGTALVRLMSVEPNKAKRFIKEAVNYVMASVPWAEYAPGIDPTSFKDRVEGLRRLFSRLSPLLLRGLGMGVSLALRDAEGIEGAADKELKEAFYKVYHRRLTTAVAEFLELYGEDLETL